MYRRLWRYASVTDLEMLIGGAAACAIVDIVLGTVGLTSRRPPAWPDLLRRDPAGLLPECAGHRAAAARGSRGRPARAAVP